MVHEFRRIIGTLIHGVLTAHLDVAAEWDGSNTVVVLALRKPISRLPKPIENTSTPWISVPMILRNSMNHPRWHRFLIAIAGPAMNIALSIGLLAGVYMFHYEYPAAYDAPTTIGWVLKDSAAAKAGIQSGDRIVRIDGIENPGWEQVDMREALSPGSRSKLQWNAMARRLKKRSCQKPLSRTRLE